MSRRARLACLAATAVAVAAGAPASAWAHASLVAMAPAANRVAARAPDRVALRFSEAIEPRYATVSVTDANGRRLARGAPVRRPGDPRTIERAVRRLRPGWYLVFWRVISADGHPVRGAFTFAVGPGPGAPPRFAVPSLRETAATPALVLARWGVLLSVMLAVGLTVLRCVVARPIGASEAGGALRALSVAMLAAACVGLVLVPVYLLVSTARFTGRSALDVGGLLPLVGLSAFGRGFADLELVLALFAVAAGAAVWLDRSERPRRSVVGLLALGSAAASAAALLLVPGLAGHPAQTAPRALALTVDWLHLAAGSVWLGGLVGLLVLWAAAGRRHRVRALATVVPRFSRVALGAVLVLVATGAAATLEHVPTVGALWHTGYGRAILAKAVLLGAALVLGAVNLLVTTPRLERAGPRDDALLGGEGATLLRRTVSGEIVLVASTLFAAAVLTSLPPPASALGRAGGALARVGPGPVHRALAQGDTRALIALEPNIAVRPTRLGVTLTRGGAPVTGATVVARFDMLDMDMGEQAYGLREVRPGTYRRSALALLMVGDWGVTFDVTPPQGRPFSLLVVDHADG